MPIIRSGGEQQVILNSQPFANEDQLQKIVAENPSLLCFDGDAPLALVTREFSLPDAGYLDILMVSADGLPVPIECKLASNSQARREVVGQIVDYVSVLTSMTVDELDHAVDGKLEQALRSFDGQDNGTGFEQRWQRVGTKLRAGQARYVIVVDEVPPDLERIIRFLIERSELDIRLVRISHYPDSDGNVLYVPSNVVDIAASERSHGSGKAPRAPTPEFQSVLDQYNRIAAVELQAVGKAPNYRQVKIPGWPGGIHYEFMARSNFVSVEFHIEKQDCPWLAEVVKKFPLELEAMFSPHRMEWDPSWSSSKGRVLTSFPISIPPAEVAEAMGRFILATREIITSSLASHPPQRP